MHANSYVKRRFIPLALNRYASIAWEGELLPDFWMWNRQYQVRADGRKVLQTVKVSELKEAALRYWMDGWVPVRPVDEGLLRRMEESLRCIKGLKAAGVEVPEHEFLKAPGPLLEELD